MFVSSASLTASMRSSIMTQQSELASAQKEIGSGTYADLGLTLGNSSGQLLGLTEQQSRLSAYSASNAVATTRLASTADAMTALQSAATSFQNSLITASSGVALSTAGLQVTATSNLNALVATLNTTVGGEAVFGGINTAATPVAAYTATSAAKTAVDNAFSDAFHTTATSAGAASITPDQMTNFVTGSFADLFDGTAFAAAWSTASDTAQTTAIAANQTVTTSVSANASGFRALAQAYTMVSEYTGSGSTLSASAQKAVITAATSVINQAVTALTAQQAEVGVAQNAITAADAQNTAQASLLSTQTGSMHDVDVYALNTRITSLQTQIEASYELTSQMKQLSLTNYLS